MNESMHFETRIRK